mmetsp:Transcript_91077/g.208759  ORF Transcript_91077/g.208759 Transcript_91077/m.208759 type:complete len:204 (-) Transcript_91077:178-789(-)
MSVEICEYSVGGDVVLVEKRHGLVGCVGKSDEVLELELQRSSSVPPRLRLASVQQSALHGHTLGATSNEPDAAVGSPNTAGGEGEWAEQRAEGVFAVPSAAKQGSGHFCIHGVKVCNFKERELATGEKKCECEQKGTMMNTCHDPECVAVWHIEKTVSRAEASRYKQQQSGNTRGAQRRARQWAGWRQTGWPRRQGGAVAGQR